MGNKVEWDLKDSDLIIRYCPLGCKPFPYQKSVATFAEARRFALRMKDKYPNFSCSLIRIWEEKIENWE